MEEEQGNKKPAKRQDAKASSRSGVPPPDNTGKKYKRHIPHEMDKRVTRETRGMAREGLFNINQCKKLVQIGCTREEVAAFFEIDPQKLDRYLKKMVKQSWKEFFKENAGQFKVALRRLQMRSAEGEADDNGNYRVVPSVPMQIWLGKQYLGQRDKQDVETTDKTNIPVFEWADAEDITDQKEITDGEEEKTRIEAGDQANGEQVDGGGVFEEDSELDEFESEGEIEDDQSE